MNHYKKSLLKARIQEQRKELDSIAECAERDKQKTIDSYKKCYNDFVVQLTPEVLDEFNKKYKDILLREKVRLSKRRFTIFQIKAKKKYLEDAEKEIDALTPISLKGKTIVYCYPKSPNYYSRTTEYNNHEKLDVAFDCYLAGREIKSFGKLPASWHGPSESAIATHQEWLNAFEIELDCIAEDNIEVTMMGNNGQIFKKVDISNGIQNISINYDD